MSPLHLRLYRGSTRLRTRTVEHAPARGDRLVLDTTYRPVRSTVDQVLSVDEPLGDEQLDGGITLVGLDLNAAVETGPEDARELDAAVVGWVRDQPHALAALRAVSTSDGATFPVYSLLVDVDADANRDELRRDLARVLARAGVPRCGIEVFCPFETISVFHVRLYGASLTLWKTDRRLPAEDGAAAGAGTEPGNGAGPAGSGRDPAGPSPASGEP